MNSLSWFLYIADAFPSFGKFVGFFGSFLIFVAVVSGPLLVELKSREKALKVLIGTIVFGLFLIIVSILIPSKQTMYAIAASEIGEFALKSPIGVKAQKAIELWIDAQIEPKK